MKLLPFLLLIIVAVASCSKDEPAAPEQKHELSLKVEGEVITFNKLVSADYIFYESGDIMGIMLRLNENDSTRLNEFTSKYIGSQIAVIIDEHVLWEATLGSSLTSVIQVQNHSKLPLKLEEGICAMVGGDVGRIVIPDPQGEVYDNAQDAVKGMLGFFGEE